MYRYGHSTAQPFWWGSSAVLWTHVLLWLEYFSAAYRNDSTFARLADPLGFVHKDDIFHAMKAIVATQRDYGRRDDRKHARMKYLVHEWGLPKFRQVVEQYFGKRLQPFRSAASADCCLPH